MLNSAFNQRRGKLFMAVKLQTSLSVLVYFPHWKIVDALNPALVYENAMLTDSWAFLHHLAKVKRPKSNFYSISLYIKQFFKRWKDRNFHKQPEAGAMHLKHM